MTTSTARTVPTAADRVELARLTRIEYERRILLGACFRHLDDIPDGELDEHDQQWRDDMYTSWSDAWDELAALRQAHDWTLYPDDETTGAWA